MTTLNFFGEQFELKFINQIIGKKQKKGTEVFRDFTYGKSIMPIIKASHFSNNYTKTIITIIKDYYSQYNSIPYYDTIREITNLKYNGEKDVLFQCLKDIENIDIENVTHIKDNGKTFIQQQNLLNELHNIREDIQKGKLSRFEDSVDRVKKSVIVNTIDDKVTFITANSYKFNSQTDRFPIPTKITRLDKAMNGGLGRGEFAILVAPYKAGKTTFAINIADAAFSEGKTVLYMFFEDTEDQIMMKCQAKWSGLTINDANNPKNEMLVTQCAKTKLTNGENKGGKLILKKFPRLNTKFSDIERYMENLVSLYDIKIDVLILDYLECVEPEKEYNDDWAGEKELAIKFESLISKSNYNCAGWTFTQGGRGSINQEEFDGSKMGGNLKKLQIAHVLFMLARTREQKEQNRATLIIEGSRIGPDITFKDIEYDNSRLKIDIPDDSIVDAFVKTKNKVKQH